MFSGFFRVFKDFFWGVWGFLSEGTITVPLKGSRRGLNLGLRVWDLCFRV